VAGRRGLSGVCVAEEGAFLRTTGSPTTTGSISEVGYRFRPFGIKDLELVAQIFTSWNLLTSWMRQIEDFQRAA
jgi:hypothetical protein